MRAPSFWNIKTGRDSAPILKALLMPFSYIYDYFTQKRIYEAKPIYLDVPVISVGNISLGGTGKTPLSIEIYKILEEIWGKPAIISRGFGGDLIGAKKVDFNASLPREVGDEPLMLSQYCDVFVGNDRVEAAKLAVANGAKILILDDGHQNPYLHKHISIVVVDGAVGFGNHQICPAGPLRESVETGLNRADCVIWIGSRNLEEEELGDFHKPIIYAEIAPKTNNFMGDYIAFCGIGRPEKFNDSLVKAGVKLVDLLPFPDHHFFKEAELKEILARANKENAKIITTEKDFVRLPQWFKEKCEIFKIQMAFNNPKFVKDFIQHALVKAIE